MNAERTQVLGLEESLSLVQDTLKGRRFDGVFGFSQGAAFAAVIAALLERPQLYPSFLVDGQPLHPPLKFCVAVSGFKVRDPLCDSIFAQPFSTPTLHVIGKTDIIVTEERSRLLVEASSDGRVEEHDGGHFVPSKGHWRKFLRDYMRDNLADIPSPGLLASSAPASGAATPIPGGSGGGPALMMKL
ncbi:serine hydrolase-domain-containing protein [Collybia nuda]|uniref:Serine hydrolase-domain-containing protein n=1 Tax=Collybia nuda TaxID=64659 RepID=A0A9P6CF64_9AGAR|nr:serine hydrolase-domain-containing protein [Collybia nuda]